MRVNLIDWIMSQYVVTSKDELIESMITRVHKRGYSGIEDAYTSFMSNGNNSV
jgi:hypothetical protein